LAPRGSDGLNVAAAACRAGALGIIDQCVVSNAELSALSSKLLRLTSRSFSVRVRANELEQQSWLQQRIERLAAVCVVLDPSHIERLEEIVQMVERHDRKAIAEVKTRTGIRQAIEAGFSALIVAGSEAGGAVGSESSLALLVAALAEGTVSVWVRGGIGPAIGAGCVAAGAAGVVLDDALLLARESPLDESCRTQIGQDAPLAERLARKYVTVGGIVQAVARAMDEGISAAIASKPLAEGSVLAVANGTRYPILQRPMTSASDAAAGALAVARAGGLPFLDLTSFSSETAETCLRQTAKQLAGSPWGVDIPGPGSADTGRLELAAVEELKPSFALVREGRPDQTAELERRGLTAYQQISSAGMLDQRLRGGTRRFVLEAGGASGDVGPTTSFLLWEQATAVVAAALDRGVPAAEISLVFGGEIQDARSAALVSAVAGPLAARGVKIGILKGRCPHTQGGVSQSGTTTLAELYNELCNGSTAYLEQTFAEPAGNGESPIRSQPSDVAIVGMAAVFPGAASVAKFWANTLRGVDSIIEVPADRWDWRMYYDPDPKAPDKIVSKWGGFVPDIPFDPLRYGMPPSSLPSIEPAQMLALEVVRSALADAGYAERPFPRERTGVVLGMGGGAAQLAMGYAFRSYLPMLDAVVPGAGRKAIEACKGLLPEWTEDSFPGFLLNVTAGRIANRLNLGGANYTVDAACGSSLAAASLAVRELETGSADVVILGGVDTVQNPFTYLAFSKTQAFSHRGRCRPFDAGADGIVISEGAAAVVLKRLADAERDGDRIYAVIKGVGASSDGRVRGLTAPAMDGQLRALSRAYAKSALSPASVGYVEAHGTGTALGDVVEVEALGTIFRAAGAAKQQCVVGSVKSLIGHTKCAAGLAGLINTSLALYHKVYPPTIGIETPNPKLDLHNGPFRLCTEAQPWVHAHPDRPRRAGVSAFGFGGTNFHAVLEEYDRNVGVNAEATIQDWPLELFVWQAEEPGQIVSQLDELAAALCSGAMPNLGDVSHTLIQARESLAASRDLGEFATLAILAGSHDDLRTSVQQARTAIAEGRTSLDDPRGIIFAARPEWSGEPVAFVFPGQGSQAPGMLQELAVLFPEVRAAFNEFDREIAQAGGRLIGPLVFPPPAFDPATREGARVALMETDVAQPAVGAACVGLLRLFRSMGLEPSVMAGHSYGELVALHAAGLLGAPALAVLSEARGRLMREASGDASGSMAALMTGPEQVESVASEVPDVQVANWNGPNQTVIAGPTVAVKKAVELAASRGIQGRLLPVSCAFHTPLVARAREPLSRLAASLFEGAPDRPVYSNLDGLPHPSEPAAVARRLGDHLARPVRFADMIAAMYRDGARVFVEVGPGSVLTTLIDSNLADRPHLAISCDVAGAPGLRAFLRAIARLVTAGSPLSLERLTRGRGRRVLDLKRLPRVEGSDNWTPSTWLVNGSRARPVAEPERRRLGMGPALRPPEAEPSRSEVPPRAELADSVAAHPAEPARFEAPRKVEPARSQAPRKIEPSRSEAPRPARAPRPIARSSSNMAAVGSGEQSDGTIKTPGTTSPPQYGKLDSHTKMKSSTTAPNSGDRVMESFQETMQAFLEVQRSTMLAYLTGRGSARAPAPAGVGSEGSEPVESKDQSVDRLGTLSRPDDLLEPSGPRAEQAGSYPPPTKAAADPMGHRGPSCGVTSNGQSHDLAGATGRAGTQEDRARRALGATAPAPPGAGEVTIGSVAVVPAPIAAAALASAGRDEITTRLLEIVRDRTGYPLETLGLDLDMEADLGIDSIKRVEILGKLRDEFPTLRGLSESAEVMEALARARTLGMIAERMVSLAEQVAPKLEPSEPAGRPKASSGAGSNGAVHFRTLRRLVETVEAPLPRQRAGLMEGGCVVITDDGRGIADIVCARLERAQIRAERLGSSSAPLDWTSPSAVEAAIAGLRARRDLAGIVHLLPLAELPSSSNPASDWISRVGHEVRGLFLLAKAAAADLENAARGGGACLIAATALGGRFASAGCTNADFFPGHGGIAGLVKTLAREWPEVRSRVVDFSAKDPPERIADHLATEIFVADGWPEIGYDRGRRVRLCTVESPLQNAHALLELKPGEPVLISGGARGITALVAAELAKTWRPTLLIVGTTPTPSEREPSDTASLRNEAEIKTALHVRLRAAGRSAGPSEIESAYQALRRLREVRENLAVLRKLGATVEYAQVDVCDPKALGVVLDGWRARYGEVVGFIHGAGLIKDKLIRHKTVESFDRVLGTKLDGALNLVRLARPESLKFAVLFSSIAGRFGNVGQSDYAAANEILNKLALWLERRWNCRVLSTIWGPWSGVGMVSQLESHLGRRGLGMIPPEVGRGLLIDELRYGKKGDVEVIYTGELGTLEEPIASEAVPEPAEAVS
jgi:acyl transferase domain-containing protein/NAD(P)H-dependent flavin oxidoreductase YrpB (nitropropane dioxygenase family)